jgi:hypothetical protein
VTSRLAVAVAAVVAFATVVSAGGCRRDGCVGGDDGSCVPPSACGALPYQCDGQQGLLLKTQLGAADLPQRPDSKARATAGDFLLENDLVRVVLAAPSHPSELAPTGGGIIDLAPKTGGAVDQINAIYQAAGLLPRDAVHYDRFQEIGSPGEGFVGVVFRGHLEADSRVTVVTRYELRPCEPGVRVRSDLYNGASDPNTLYLADGLFWGDNGALPFVPGVGLGFRAPSLDLKHVADAWREGPFVAARTQAPPDAAYAVVPCDRAQSAGFNDPTLSAAGVPLATTLPGDGLHLERFIIAVPGPGLSPAVGEALQVRAKVHGETPPVTVSGRVVAAGQPFDGKSGRAASLLFYEPAFGPDPDDPARRKPWSEVVPGADGTFSLWLPADRSYRVQPFAFGLPAGPATSFIVARGPAEIGDLTLPAAAHLMATVTTTPGQPQAPGAAVYSELVVVPAAPTAGGDTPSLYGQFAGCNPMLGPPHGASPACNRAVSEDGNFNLLIPAPGHYYIYATRGPFATLDRADITIGPGEEVRVGLVVQSLSMLPAGVFSGDFHVHGAASYDSSIPDDDRVRSFLASGVDLVVATDHDVVTSYSSVLDAMGAADRLVVISGTEQTPNIPWFVVPGEDLPKTLGHFNFWPLTPDLTQPRSGAPWAELREPGQMMDDMEARFIGGGVRQLNHPLADSKLGRDQGFLRAIGYDPRTPIVPGASFAADVLLRTPGAVHRNIDWDAQEVMTGASPANWLHYRALWFSLLSQGIVRAGTANSDTHSLSLEQVGYPRNLVVHDPKDPEAAVLDVERFDEDVRRGHMVGTTGPVLDVSIIDDAGQEHRPGLEPIPLLSGPAQISMTITFAPWIPVTELRVIVNGVTHHIDITSDLPMQIDHLGTAALSTHTRQLSLSQFLPAPPYNGDAWLVVEAGIELDDPVDRDGDGLPDLSDDDTIRLSDPTLADYHAVVPGAWPVAFTNPFLLDLDGGGWQAPGLP